MPVDVQVPPPDVSVNTLVDLLHWRAQHQPERRAYSFLVDDEAKEVHLSYAELDRRARAIGALLQGAGAAGERVLLLYPPSLEYIAAFFGCLYAGAMAVPAYPPNPARLDRTLPRLRAIAVSARPAIALTTTPILALAQALGAQDPAFGTLRWAATDALGGDQADAWTSPALDGATPTFLQYTSGSTAAPKGVILTHANLLHNSALIHAAFGHTPESRGVIWLPPYHDMGLIGGILQPLYGGFPVTLMSPVAFLQRPLRWLEAITRTQATTSGGPNFAYDLCVRKITPEQRATLDLSSWQVAFNGAEPIRAATLDRFVEAFAPCGFRRQAFYSCYGLAEATLIVSGGQIEAPPVVRSFEGPALERNRAITAAGGESAAERMLVGSGAALAGQQIAIVDPGSLERCASGQVGEIWVAGPSVAQGYWGQPEATEATFRATIVGDGAFLRTGDLGFIQDGELFITGRLKDLIIIRGRNHYPQDIELTVERSHPALRPGCGAAFTVEVDGEERLVVVQEIERQYRQIDGEELAAAIRSAVAGQHELQVYAVVLLKPGGIPKTSSGKIQRHACRAGFLSGELEALARSVIEGQAPDAGAEDPTREAILALGPEARRPLLETYLAGLVARLLRVDRAQVDAGQPLGALGLNSLAAVELQHAIESSLGLVVPMVYFLEGRSIAELAAGMLEQLISAPAAAPPAHAPAPHQVAEHPLSLGQRALWFLHQLAPDSAAYNIPLAVRIRGPLAVPALRMAFQALVERHPALRTTFRAPQGEPLQQVHGAATVAFVEEDASQASEAALDERLVAEAHRPFDLEHGPLLRVHLLRRSEHEHLLMLVVHHLIADMWSLTVLVQELGALYPALQAGLPPLALEYTDYARWQSAAMGGPQGARLLDYWQRRLAGAQTVLELPADRPRPPLQTYRGAVHSFKLNDQLSRALNALAQRTGATLYTTLLAAFQALLWRYTGQDDILVGAATTGRSRADLASIVGYFVNLIPLRANLAGNPTFAALLEQTRRATLEAFAHQDYPFPLLVEHLQPERDLSRHPLFQVVFVLQKAHLPNDRELGSFALGDSRARMELGGLAIESVALEQQIAQFDMTVFMAEAGGGLAGTFQYNADLFEAATIARMAGHFETLLGAIAIDPALPVSRLPVLTQAERRQLLVEWNESAADYPRSSCFHELFEAQAARTPAAIAVVCEGQQISYGELNGRTNQLAHHLRSLGVGPDVLVALCMERSLEVIVGIVGILKAGGAYVPLDPSYPAERLQYMLADSRAAVLLTSQEQRTKDKEQRTDSTTDRKGVLHTPPVHTPPVHTPPVHTPPVHTPPVHTPPVHTPPADDVRATPPEDSRQPTAIDLIADWPTIARQPTTNPDRVVLGEHLAYIIYTSGSTGRPKGVMVQQRGLLNLCYGLRAFFDDAAVTTTALITSFSFDISVNQVFPTLLFGRTLHIIPDTLKYDSRAFVRYLTEHQIDLFDAVPSYLNAVLTEIAPARVANQLRFILVGGERLEKRLLAKVFEQLGGAVQIVNIYGLTEITDINALAVIGSGDLERTVTIGRPLQNNRIYITNRDGSLQPLGVTGEVCVSGESLSRGYLYRPELTAEKFAVCPFEDGALMVRTGDVGRRLPDGTIELLGRMDHQIKLRGFRIEIGEIEALLASHPGVRENVVIVREDTPGDQRLVAYVVPTTEDRGLKIEDSSLAAQEKLSSILYPLSSDLRQFLRDRLPDYMIPAAFVLLDELPHTPNGKIDRKALPAPGWSSEQEGGFVAPRTPTEDLVAGIWADVLTIERVGVHDNFFALGGHSLLATRLVSQVRDAFGIELPLRALFEAPSVAGLAEQIEAARRETTGRQAGPIRPASGPGDPSTSPGRGLPLSFAQQRLWLLDQFEPGNPAYNIPLAVRLTGPLDVAAWERAINQIVGRHAALRATFVSVEGRAVQVIAPVEAYSNTPLPVRDLTASPPGEREAEAQRLIAEEGQRPFDLAHGPLLRASLLRLGAQEHIALLTMHHIVSDGWSMHVFIGELSTLYTAYTSDGATDDRGDGTGVVPPPVPSPLPPLPIQYTDFASWQADWMQGEVLETQLAYWRQQLAGVPPVIDLPTDWPRAAVRTFRGARQQLSLPQNLSESLTALSQREGATPFMVLLAAFKVLLARYTGQPDIVVGTPIAGRSRGEIEGLIGCFLNTLVLRADLSGDPSFHELLWRVREVCLGAYAHQDLPFEKLLEKLQPERDLSYTPLFQVFFNMLNFPDRRITLPGLTLEVLESPEIGSKFDITLYVEERDRRFHFDLVYNADLFAPERMRGLLDQLELLLGQVAQRPEELISALSLVTDQARARLPDPTEPLDATWEGAVHTALARQARRVPGRPALIDPHESWSYAELDARSNQLANHLIAHGIQREDVVAIYAHRSAPLVWALMGVLKAGAAFTILDPAYPQARLISYLRLARPRAWIQLAVASPPPDELEQFVAAMPLLCRVELPRDPGAARGLLMGVSADDPAVQVGPDTLACVGFTSGSTGKPKGILGLHGPLTHFLPWQCGRFELGESDRFSMLSGIAHDPLQRDIFTPLWLGATICIPEPEDFHVPGRLAAWMWQAEISIAHLTPALGQLLTETAPDTTVQIPSLRYAFIVGDVLDRPRRGPDSVAGAGDHLRELLRLHRDSARGRVLCDRGRAGRPAPRAPQRDPAARPGHARCPTAGAQCGAAARRDRGGGRDLRP